MSYKHYKTLEKAKCIDINKRKIDILNNLKLWQDRQIDRCFNLFRQGRSFKYVYNSFKKNVSSTYKSKITNCAQSEYITYCKKNNVYMSQDYFKRNTGSSRGWVYDSQIADFKIRKNLGKFFQLETCIKLPFEMDGQTKLVLEAKLPKKFWKKGFDKRVYTGGFNLCINGDDIELGLIEKKEVEKRYQKYLKAIYVSPSGGLHIASCDYDYQSEDWQHNSKEFIKCNYGFSRESKAFLNLLDKMRDMSNKDKYNDNMVLAKAKLRHRINKYFASMKKHFGKVIVAQIIDNESRMINELQEDAIEKIKSLCHEFGIEFKVIAISQKELGYQASLTMKKDDRSKLYEQKKVAPNRYKAVAIIKKYFMNSGDTVAQKTRFGIVNYRTKRKQNEMFSENVSTVGMSQQELIEHGFDEIEEVVWT